MRLAESHVRVPRFGGKAWQPSERSEYRCKACGEYGVLRLGRIAYVLYAALLGGLAAAWMQGVRPSVVVSLGLIGAFVIYRGGSRLAAARPPH